MTMASKPTMVPTPTPSIAELRTPASRGNRATPKAASAPASIMSAMLNPSDLTYVPFFFDCASNNRLVEWTKA